MISKAANSNCSVFKSRFLVVTNTLMLRTLQDIEMQFRRILTKFSQTTDEVANIWATGSISIHQFSKERTITEFRRLLFKILVGSRTFNCGVGSTKDFGHRIIRHKRERGLSGVGSLKPPFNRCEVRSRSM